MPTAEVVEKVDWLHKNWILEAEEWVLLAHFHPPAGKDEGIGGLWSEVRKEHTNVGEHGETTFSPTWVRELWDGERLEDVQWLGAVSDEGGTTEWVFGAANNPGNQDETFSDFEAARRHADIHKGGFSTERPPGI